MCKPKDNSIESEIARLTALIALKPDDDSLLVSRGKLFWQVGRRGEAMSDYQKAAGINPRGAGKLLYDHSLQIMEFFNPDLLNP